MADLTTADDQSSDQHLVTAVLAGDQARFALLVQRYHGPLFQLALNRLGHQQLAEDAVQETFVNAYRSLASYKPQYAFRTWLWTILINQCRRQGAKQSRQEQREWAASQPEQICNQTPVAAALVQERNGLLRQWLQELPEPQADAVRLRFFGQLKYQEIADVMQSSLSAAKQRVRYGLSTLSERLAGQEWEDYLDTRD